MREERRGYHERLLREEGGGHSEGVDTGSEVTEQVGPPGGSSLHALHLAQVAGHLAHTLPEANTQEVWRQGGTCRGGAEL